MSGIADGIVIGGKVDFQRFTNTSGTHTWNKPAGVTTVCMEVIGGGGGGGSRWSASGCGGGGGGTRAMGTYTAASLPATLTVTVGIAGLGGTSASLDLP